MTTRGEISNWFDRGVAEGAAFMIVACDTFDWDDYPVFVPPADDLQSSVARYNGPNMQKVMEVYDLNADKETQLNKGRCRADLVP